MQCALTPIAVAQILPADPNAAGGGNPLEGLGRTDDPNPARTPDASMPAPDGSSNPPPPDGSMSGDTSSDTTSDTAPAQDGLIPPDSSGDVPKPPSPAKPANTPLKKALAQIMLGKYDAGLTILNAYIEKNDKDAQAHYLKAVALVMLRQFSLARKEYGLVLKLSPGGELARRAEEGLKKLNH